MKKLASAFLLLLAVAFPARAAINARDNVPAATLLLPYFEVDLANANGAMTTFHVGNLSQNPTLAHVTLWTDEGVPTYSFDIYLGGYDVEEVDLRLLFLNGLVPQTSSTLTAAGSDSGAHTTFPNCAGNLPPANLTPTMIAGLQNAHTGAASTLLSNQCGGSPHGDNKARGYITIDSTSSCTTGFPGTAGYFVNGGTGVATDNNVLFGDFLILDRANNFSYGNPLVAIEASATDPETSAAGDYTFYSKVIGGFADNREALGQMWMERYVNNGLFTGGTDAFIWQDPGSVAAFPCNTPPASLSAGQLTAFDEQEQVAQVHFPIPLATQSIDLTSAGIPFSSGVLNYVFASASRQQSWVGHVFRGPNGAGLLAGWQLASIVDATFFLPSVSATILSPDSAPQCSSNLLDFLVDPGCAPPGPNSETDHKERAR